LRAVSVRVMKKASSLPLASWCWVVYARRPWK
jgi:hypothetical protein